MSRATGGGERFESASASWLVRSRIAAVATTALTMLFFALITMGARSFAQFVMQSALLVFLVPAGTLFYWRLAPLSQIEGAVSADRRGLYRDGVLVFARERMKQGLVVRDGKGCRVQIDGKKPWESAFIGVSDLEEGRALLRSLGLDATQATADVFAASPIVAKPYVPILMGLTIPFTTVIARSFHAPAAQVPYFLIATVATFVALYLTPTRVRVGTDGILTSWLGRQRFYSYGEITSIEKYESRGRGRAHVGIEIYLAEGGTVRIPMGQKRTSDGDVQKLYDRISAAVDAYRSGATGEELSALARGARPIAEWIDSLRALGVGAGADLRRAAMPPDRLMAVALDSTASPLARAGAAVAMGGVIDEGERERIRVAAESVASPKLRIALGRAVDPNADEHALEEALAELEAEEREADKSATPR